VLHGCRVFLPLIREQGEGHIVNTASLAAFATGLPTFAPYTTSKFAILAASECLELELHSGGEAIGVSALCPGVVRTRMPEAERNRPADVPSSEGDPLRQSILGELRRLADGTGMEPAEVAGMVVDAIRERRFFVLTHPDEAFAALQRRIDWMRTGIAPGERVPGRAGAASAGVPS
jgi:NAD(P)-dependent dehydrogenase (short-subunit alcohol dehydrogenase family)